MDAQLAKGPNHVHGEKGQPAHNETTDDDRQRFGRLRFHAKSFRLYFQYTLADTFDCFAAICSARRWCHRRRFIIRCRCRIARIDAARLIIAQK